jgi:small-conductance mechanosensitive channel
MITLEAKITLTAALVICMFSMMYLTRLSLRKFTLLRSIEANRRKVILNLIYFSIYILAFVFLGIIWGVNMNQLTLFVSSVLAVVGVGFFAQWSILSNLTSSVILFFNHPVRIGDKIRILDKDFELTGEVTDISGFFFFITTDKGEHITMPNNLVIQKGIEIIQTRDTTT